MTKKEHEEDIFVAITTLASPTRVRPPSTVDLSPALLQLLFLQSYPNATWLASVLGQIDPERLAQWMRRSGSTQNQVQEDIHAWLQSVSITDADTVEKVLRFLLTLRRRQWFAPFKQAGWTAQDINPFVLLYAVRVLASLYQETGSEQDALQTPKETPEARIIACPWILVQVFWEMGGGLTPHWGDPPTVLQQLATLAQKSPTSDYPADWMPEFAALILAFLETMRRTGNSVLIVRPEQAHNWIARAAHWLHQRPQDLQSAWKAMSDDGESATITRRRAVYRAYFAPAFRFVVSRSPNPQSASRPHFALSGLYWQEIRTAMMVRARLQKDAQDTATLQFPLPPDWTAHLDAVRVRGQRLDDEQRLALTTMWQSPLTILTGPPGSGKSTLLAVFAELMDTMRRLYPAWPALGRIRWMAPSGKAAEQLRQRLGALVLDPEDAPRTIHSHLSMYPQLIGFPPNRVAEQCSNDLYNGALVVDEFTMCDTSLMHAIFRVASLWDSNTKHYEAAPFRLILSGDPEQLPPVNPGYPVGILDALDQRPAPPGVRHPHVAIQTVHRHQGAITALLQAVRERDAQALPAFAPTDNVQFREVGSLDAMRTMVHQLVDDIMAQTPLAQRDVPTILAATNQVVDHFNTDIQAWVHPHMAGRVGFTPGDKVLYRRNDLSLGLVNGTDGTVVSVEADHGFIEWNQTQGHTVVLPFSPQSPIMLSYVMTVHKAQGSEWPVVIILAPRREWLVQADDEDDDDTKASALPVIPGWHDRRLVYTALSRAQERLYIVSGLPLPEWTSMALQLSVKSRVSQVFRSLVGNGKYAIPWPAPAPPNPSKRRGKITMVP